MEWLILSMLKTVANIFIRLKFKIDISSLINGYYAITLFSPKAQRIRLLISCQGPEAKISLSLSPIVNKNNLSGLFQGVEMRYKWLNE
jgi:hypothetical protein